MDSNYKIVPLPERPRPGIAPALAMVLAAAAGLWVTSLAAALLNPSLSLSGELVNALMFYLPFVILPVTLYSLRHRGLSDALRLNPMPVLPALTVVFLGLLSVYIASGVDALWTALLSAAGLHPPEAALDVTTSRALTAQILLSAALPAVCEELLFRGVVFSAFEGRGTWRGVWLSSALFALMHGNLFGLPAYLLVGALSAYIVYALDSLYAGMLFHTVYNTAILVIMHMASGMPQAGEAAAALSPVSLVLDFIITGALIASSLMTLELRRRVSGIEPLPRSPEPLGRRNAWMLAAVTVLLVFNNLVIQFLTEAGL